MNILKKTTSVLLAILITSFSLIACESKKNVEASKEENTIGIIGAMNEELEVLLKDMKNQKEVKRNDLTFYEGDLWGQHVVAVVSGVGKVNAASCTQILASEFNVKSLINIGVAGGVSKDIYPGDIVIGDTYVQHDLDEEFNAKAVEMESAAIAQVAYINKIPFVIIRSISDNANNGAHMDYKEFIPVGVKNSTSILKSMFENM